MAAAEARAVWQRAVNRCFVQEDAKRAPKLACCQSSSSASTKQADSVSSGAVELPDQTSPSSMPLNQNPRFPNLHPDMRWWANMQPPGYVNQKGLNNEQIDPLEMEMDISKELLVNSPIKDNDNQHTKDEQDFTKCEKHNLGVGENELNNFKFENMGEFIDLVETMENYDFVGMNRVGLGSSKKSNDLSYDSGSPWNDTNEKTKPWWRTTDKDELASFVAQRSLDYIENCDLPAPQKMHTRKDPRGNSRCLDCDEFSSLDYKSKAVCASNANIHKRRASTEDGHVRYGSEKPFRCSHGANTDLTEAQTHASEAGLSKAELLEALRHSQTRAREAEKAAKEVYAEKEHLVTLLFKQASQLFAYKQWFQLLQLEALYLQIKNDKDPLIATRPWMPCGGRKARKRLLKGKKGKGGRSKADITRYAVAFALGLSLVGAGLLLGWTVGWMLPF